MGYANRELKFDEFLACWKHKWNSKFDLGYRYLFHSGVIFLTQTDTPQKYSNSFRGAFFVCGWALLHKASPLSW